MKLSVLRNTVLAAAAALFSIGAATQVHAFCFSNDTVSAENLLARQIKEKDIKALKKYEKCMVDSQYYEPFDAKPDPRPDWKKNCEEQANISTERFAGSSLFKASVKPGQMKCCSYKDKDCNPSGKKSGKISFVVGSKFYVRKFGAQNIDWLAADENYQTFYRVKATDHVVCRTSRAAGTKKFKDPKNAKSSSKAMFNAYAPKCQVYSWPHSPPWHFKKTSHGRLIKSVHSDKCLEIGGWNKKNGANVNMWKCHGGKNQR